MNGISGFADDTMRIGERLTLNFGVRFDHFGAGVPSFPVLDLEAKETGARSAEAPGLINWNLIAPRLGFVLKLDAAGRTVLKGHYGRYYHGINSAGQFETLSPSILPYHSFTGRYDAAGNPIGLVRLRDNTNQRIDPELRRSLHGSVQHRVRARADPATWACPPTTFTNGTRISRAGATSAGPTLPATFIDSARSRRDRAIVYGAAAGQPAVEPPVRPVESGGDVRPLQRPVDPGQQADVEPVAAPELADAVEVRRPRSLEPSRRERHAVERQLHAVRPEPERFREHGWPADRRSAGAVQGAGGRRAALGPAASRPTIGT